MRRELFLFWDMEVIEFKSLARASYAWGDNNCDVCNHDYALVHISFPSLSDKLHKQKKPAAVRRELFLLGIL